MSAEEGLGARENMSDDDGGAEGVKNVFIIGVEE